MYRKMQVHLIWAALLILPVCMAADGSADSSDSPIIGVLTQEIRTGGLISRHFDNKTSYIAASYVKFLEGAGARVVPIWINRKRSYYENLMQKINGVLLPGGATWFNQSNGYADAGEHLINIAMQLNDNGTFMPVWGTCLGMELLVYKLANGTEARTDCNSLAQALPLQLKQDFNNSRLFGGASEQIIQILSTENVTFNWHQFCYTEKTFVMNRLYTTWRVLTLNEDWNGTEFISSIEHVRYPFYGVQFHPEKPLYEFRKEGGIPHTAAAVVSSQYFADFVVNEARRSPNRFTNATELTNALIYNYKPEYTSPLGSAFVQQYLFEDIDFPDEDNEGGSSSTSYYPLYGIGRNGTASLAVAFEVIFAVCLWFLATI